MSRWEANRWQRLRGWTEWIMARDRMIHEPSRLAIVTILREQGRVDYLDLLECTDLSKGNLSNHLEKLEDSGWVAVEKHFEAKKPVTTVILTGQGLKAVDAYWTSMKNIGTGLQVRDAASMNGEATAPPIPEREES